MSFMFADVLEGYNGTIFAYGQTSSGKTHTMEVKWSIRCYFYYSLWNKRLKFRSVLFKYFIYLKGETPRHQHDGGHSQNCSRHLQLHLFHGSEPGVSYQSMSYCLKPAKDAFKCQEFFLNVSLENVAFAGFIFWSLFGQNQRLVGWYVSGLFFIPTPMQNRMISFWHAAGFLSPLQ